MVAYLEKTEGNAQFHKIVDFLSRSSIFYALTVSPNVSTSLIEQFWNSAVSQTVNNGHAQAKEILILKSLIRSRVKKCWAKLEIPSKILRKEKWLPGFGVVLKKLNKLH
ncbi:hypothetical protein Tco_1430220 [Tanacetum coccineum]|uniref:Uncharacterized protein n=1 Tax=Tanacetum coccineum TaxID=301880 RepID=A0ABQ4ZLR4_9ASTR